MTLRYYLLLSLCITPTILPTPSITTDEQAYVYCEHNHTTFIAIVWPITHQKYDLFIEKTMNELGTIQYKKEVFLTPKQATSLLKMAHPFIDDMKKHVAWYFPSSKTFANPARIFVVTFKNRATAVACKSIIRHFIKLSYRPIHICDVHKETMELAKFFFG